MIGNSLYDIALFEAQRANIPDEMFNIFLRGFNDAMRNSKTEGFESREQYIYDKGYHAGSMQS